MRIPRGRSLVRRQNFGRHDIQAPIRQARAEGEVVQATVNTLLIQAQTHGKLARAAGTSGRAAAIKAQSAGAFGAAVADAFSDIADHALEYEKRKGDQEELRVGVQVTEDMAEFERQQEGRTTFRPSEVPKGINVNRDRNNIPVHEVMPQIRLNKTLEFINKRAMEITDSRRRNEYVMLATKRANERYISERRSAVKTIAAYNRAEAIGMMSDAQKAGDWDLAESILEKAHGDGTLTDATFTAERQVIAKGREKQVVNNAIANNDLGQIKGAISELMDKDRKSPLNSAEERTALNDLRAAEKKLETHNKKENEKGEAQAYMDKNFAERGDMTQAQFEEQARKKLKNKPNVRDDVMRRIAERYGDLRAADTRKKTEARDAMFGAIHADVTDTSWTTNPDLSPEDRKAGVEYQHKMRAGLPILTVTDIYNELNALRVSPDPVANQKFLDTDMSKAQYITGLSKQDHEFMVKRQEEMKKDPGATSGVSSLVKKWNATLGLKQGTPTKPQSDVVRRLSSHHEQTVNLMLEERAKELKRRLTASERDGVINGYYAKQDKVEVEGRFFGTNTGRYRDIPTKTRLHLVGLLKSAVKAGDKNIGHITPTVIAHAYRMGWHLAKDEREAWAKMHGLQKGGRPLPQVLD